MRGNHVSRGPGPGVSGERARLLGDAPLFPQLDTSGFISDAQDQGKNESVGGNLQIEIRNTVKENGECASDTTQSDGAPIAPTVGQERDNHPAKKIKDRQKEQPRAQQAGFRRDLQVVVVGVVHQKIHQARLKPAVAQAEGPEARSDYGRGAKLGK